MKNFLCALCLVCILPALVRAETVEIYEADVKPWSGYWWPSSSGGLLTGTGYRGKPAVLDKLKAISSVDTSAVNTWYQENFYKPEGESWYGMCHAWALAAIAETEPVRGGVYKGVPLNVGDKKALLTLAHAGDVCQKGNGANPLVYHQWILSFLRDQKKAFTVNLQQNGGVWFFPVFRAEVRSTDGVGYTDFVTTIWYASDFVLPDFVGTRELFSRHSYRLYKESDSYVRGEWTGDSVNEYPGNLWNTLERQGPPVDGFDTASVEAAVRTDTNDLSVELMLPGSYSAFLETDWSRPLDVEAGEWLELEFTFENQYVSVPVTITDGTRTYTETVSQTNPTIRYYCRTARPVLSLYPELRLANSPFSLRFDLARDPLAVQTRRGSSFAWGGVAGLFNSSDNGRAFLTMRGRDGRPLRSVSLDAAPRNKFARVFDLAEFDSWVFGRADQCEITSRQTPALVGLGAYGKGMSAFSALPVAGPQWAYGYLPNLGSATSFHVRNSEARSVSGTVRGWDARGWEVFTQTVTLAPHELRFFSWGSYPVPAPQGASLFSIDFGTARVSLESCFVSQGIVEMVPAAGEFSREFLLSHYPNAGGWGTTLHILNPWATTVEVGIETADGRRLRTVFVPPHRSVEVETASFPVTGQTLYVRSDVSMAAHVRYQSVGDWAMLPLTRAEQTKREILIPHLPDAPWWAGVILDNANVGECEVALEYFGASGESLHTERRVLAAQEPWVFAPSRVPGAGYLKVRSSAPLGCGVLYGSEDLSAVAAHTP